jgi:hypothetical protein
VAALQLRRGHRLQPARSVGQRAEKEVMVNQNQLEELASASVLLGVIQAWRVFKASHDVQDAKIACCAKTVKLFDALDELEKEILYEREQAGRPTQ